MAHKIYSANFLIGRGMKLFKLKVKSKKMFEYISIVESDVILDCAGNIELKNNWPSFS